MQVNVLKHEDKRAGRQGNRTAADCLASKSKGRRTWRQSANMRRIERIVTPLALIFLVSGQAIGGEYNPFLKPSSPLEQRVNKKLKTSSPIPQLPLPSMPPPPVLGGLPLPATQSGAASQPKVVWHVVGMINNQVTLSNNAGHIAIVENGSSKDGCFVDYPNYLCDPADISAARQRRAAAPVVAESIKAETTQDPAPKPEEDSAQGMTAELQQVVKELKKQLADSQQVKESAAEAETAGKKYNAAKAELNKAISERDQVMKQRDETIEVLKRQAKELQEAQKAAATARSESEAKAREVSAGKDAVLKLKNDNAEIQVNAEKAKRDLVDLQKQLAAREQENARLRAEHSALKADFDKVKVAFSELNERYAQSPEWARGLNTEYQDKHLGLVSLAEGDKEICFKVSGRVERTADSMFGNNVFRKERKGEYVYYAIDRRAVNIRGL